MSPLFFTNTFFFAKPKAMSFSSLSFSLPRTPSHAHYHKEAVTWPVRVPLPPNAFLRRKSFRDPAIDGISDGDVSADVHNQCADRSIPAFLIFPASCATLSHPHPPSFSISASVVAQPAFLLFPRTFSRLGVWPTHFVVAVGAPLFIFPPFCFSKNWCLERPAPLSTFFEPLCHQCTTPRELFSLSPTPYRTFPYPRSHSGLLTIMYSAFVVTQTTSPPSLRFLSPLGHFCSEY